MWSEWVFTLSSIMLSGHSKCRRAVSNHRWKFADPNMHIGSYWQITWLHLLHPFSTNPVLQISENQRKTTATQVGTIPSPQSILYAYQQGADPNTMVSAAGPWSCGSFIGTSGWILHTHVYIYICGLGFLNCWYDWNAWSKEIKRSWVKLDGRLLFPS